MRLCGFLLFFGYPVIFLKWMCLVILYLCRFRGLWWYPIQVWSIYLLLVVCFENNIRKICITCFWIFLSLIFELHSQFEMFIPYFFLKKYSLLINDTSISIFNAQIHCLGTSLGIYLTCDLVCLEYIIQKS